MSVEQVAKSSHNDGNFGTIKRPRRVLDHENRGCARHLPDAGTFSDGEKVSGIDLSRPVDFDLSRLITFDLDGDLDRMAWEVAELMAAPLEIDLSPPTDATKAAPGPDAKPSFRR